MTDHISTMAFFVEPPVRAEHNGYIMGMLQHTTTIYPGTTRLDMTITEAEAIRALREEALHANIAVTNARRALIRAENDDAPLYTRHLRAERYRKAVRAYKLLSTKLAAALCG